jgi:hypothetical protein
MILLSRRGCPDRGGKEQAGITLGEAAAAHTPA